MLIRELFGIDRDPTRALNEVVNAEEAIDVRSEIDEYVFTDHTLAYLRELMEGLLDTAQSNMPDCLRAWISGFFGSGKSHFLKLSATLLSNQPIKLTDGNSAPALSYAVEKHHLSLPWERIAREFRIKSIVLNLATAVGGGKQAQEKPLLYRLTSELHRMAGDSTLPHIAELEREIRKAKKWEQFLSAVRDECERVGDLDSQDRPLQWTSSEIRDKATDAHRILECVLPKVLTKFSDGAAVRNYLRDGEAQAPSADSVVKLALRAAEELDAEYGRILLCVDEVSLYLTGNSDRVREVSGLAETVKSKGKGKVLLWVTAQQRVDTVDHHFAALDSKVGFLRDRFLARFPLEESDIDTVVRERWLKKAESGAAFGALERLVKEHGGLLARAAKLHDENVVPDTVPLTDEKAVLAYYPCLPYHVRLLQAVLAALRGEKQVDQTAAQSRALLTAIRSLFVRKNGANLAEADVSVFCTFDRVYDVIRDVVRKADSSTDQWITQTIEQSLGSAGSVKASSVAKVIFLLQSLNPPGFRRIKVDADNVAALLYPRLGAAWEPHLKDVREACARLLTEHYIGEEPDSGYRFYRQEEKSFQKEVDGQPLEEPQVHAFLGEAIGAQAAVLGMKTIAVNAWHKLPVGVAVHVGGISLPDAGADPKGLELHFVWPKPGTPARQPKLWAQQYMGASHIVIWYLSGSSEAEELARRALKLESAIKDYGSRFGQQALDFLRNEQAKLDKLRDELIPTAIQNAIASGQVIHRGVDTPLGGQVKKPQEVYRETMKAALDQVFSEIATGSALVDEAGLKKVFSWQPPSSQPDFFATLKLFDAGGRPLSDRPFLKEIALALRGRMERDRTGAALLEHFLEPPYGWPERAVKAGFGALLRGRLLTVKLADGTVLRAPGDQKADSWLSGAQLFTKSVLDPSDLTLTPEEREALTGVFEEAFQSPGADTLEKLEQRAEDVLPEFLSRAREAHADLAGRQLPGITAVKKLVDLLDGAASPDLSLGKLRQLLDGAIALIPGAKPIQAKVALKPLCELVRIVERLRTQGKLDDVAGARRRATALYNAWETAGGSAAVVTDWAALKAQVATDNLLSGADDAIARDRRIFAAYAADYRGRHDERNQRAASMLAAIDAHPEATKAPPSALEQLKKPIAALACLGAAELALPTGGDGVCPECRSSLGNLRTDIELVEHRAQQALRKLDELAEPKKPEVPEASGGGSLSMELRSPDDLPRLFEKISEVAQKELTRPRCVRITFEDPER